MVAEDVLIRRAEIVRIHLDILEGLIEEPISTSAAIRASVSLRFLSDGALSQLGHDLGQSIAIPAPDLADIEIEQVLTFACGGYVLAGVEICPHYLYRFSGENSPIRAHFERQIKTSPAQHRLVEHRLSKFMLQPCLAILGTTFTREAVVRYVANKCGGAHHHDDPGGFAALDHAITNVGHGLELSTTGLSAVFLEVLGTAYFLIKAPDISALRARLEADQDEASVGSRKRPT
ncbi:hypothetical protein [Sphingomonas sp. 2378]|uniref:hypothetical protein n=1 Tax=Sphingomonas sp. 2378 TaxID=1219748 RepID=UPI00311AC1A5